MDVDNFLKHPLETDWEWKTKETDESGERDADLDDLKNGSHYSKYDCLRQVEVEVQEKEEAEVQAKVDVQEKVDYTNFLIIGFVCVAVALAVGVTIVFMKSKLYAIPVNY